jgi:hypothetical protein
MDANAGNSLRDENRQNTRIAAKQGKAAKPGAGVRVANCGLDIDAGILRGLLRIEDKLETDHCEEANDLQDNQTA